MADMTTCCVPAEAAGRELHFDKSSKRQKSEGRGKEQISHFRLADSSEGSIEVGGKESRKTDATNLKTISK